MNESDIRPTLGATVVVCCIHGREKRQPLPLSKVTIPKGFISHCLCCESVVESETDAPQMCTQCSPKILGGEKQIG